MIAPRRRRSSRTDCWAGGLKSVPQGSFARWEEREHGRRNRTHAWAGHNHDVGVVTDTITARTQIVAFRIAARQANGAIATPITIRMIPKILNREVMGSRFLPRWGRGRWLFPSRGFRDRRLLRRAAVRLTD